MVVSRTLRCVVEHGLHWCEVRASLRGAVHFSVAAVYLRPSHLDTDLLVSTGALAKPPRHCSYGAGRGLHAGRVSRGSVRLHAPWHAGGHLGAHHGAAARVHRGPRWMAPA